MSASYGDPSVFDGIARYLRWRKYRKAQRRQERLWAMRTEFELRLARVRAHAQEQAVMPPPR